MPPRRSAPETTITAGSGADGASGRSGDELRPLADERSDEGAGGGAEQHGGCAPERRRGEQPGEQRAERDPEAERQPDRVPVPHGRAQSSGGAAFRPGVFWTYNQSVTDDRPQLVFFSSERSGPARRMESLLAHLERKERDRLRVRRVDVDANPELAERFRIDVVPTLVLVKDRRAVSRLDGRTSAPRIEAMLEPHLPVLAIA